MRRAFLCLAALLCAVAAPAAERAAVVPAVPASVAAPVIAAPRVNVPAASVLPNSLALSLGAGLPSATLPSGVAPQVSAAPIAGTRPGAAAAPASAADAPERADASRALSASGDAVAATPSAMREISAIGGNLTERGAKADESASGSRGGEAVSARLDHAFDGAALRGSSVAEPPAVAGRESRWTARLGRSTRSLAKKAGLAAVATLLFATPALAQTAGSAAGPIMTQSMSLAWLSAIQPIAAAAGAVLGALYGLIIARGKDSDASGGDALAAALRYGVIGGASVYMLLDLTHLAFVGPGVGLKPLSSAVATAALGRAAFQGKFSDAATTSADRIVAAFPAVAAALGLSIGINMIAPALSYTVAMTAMAVTGIASAIYAAIFKAGRSPANGPALMAKGYVLQALMCGLALALTTPWQVWTFAIMGGAGFALVLWAFGRELWSLIPRRPAPPAPPKA